MVEAAFALGVPFLADITDVETDHTPGLVFWDRGSFFQVPGPASVSVLQGLEGPRP